MEKENKKIKKTNSNKFVSFLKENYKEMLIAFLGVFVVALLGSLATDTNSTWWKGLVLPSFYPPSMIFGIMWTILYILIGIGLYLVLKKGITKNQTILYALNGVLNVLWSFVFFKGHNLFFSVIIIVALIISAYFLLKSLYDNNRVSFYLTVPYFIWLFFAFLLNYAIYFLN